MTENKKHSFWSYIIIGYIIIWQIMSFYYWFKYTQENDFWDGVLFGFFVSEFKGLFWIFNIW